jgi:hypothetical protein
VSLLLNMEGEGAMGANDEDLDNFLLSGGGVNAVDGGVVSL